MFWFSDADKKWYEDTFGIVHSRCYTEYGLKRTGCTGCPFGLHLFEELAATEKAEPNVVKAANHIFADAYLWTKQYKEYIQKIEGDQNES